MLTRKKILLVGCGQWGQYILRDLLSLGCEVTVVGRSAATRARAQELGAQRVVPTLDQVTQPDGVVVATPSTTHASVVNEVLRFDVPVFVEKPLATDLVSAQQLAVQGSEKIFVMHKWRYHPGILKLKELASSGSLGQLISLKTVRHGWGNPHHDIDATWHLLPHDLSIVFEILGSLPTPTAAQGTVVNGVPESLIGFLGNEPGVCVDVSSQAPLWRREITVTGTQGVALLDGSYAPAIKIFRGDLNQPIKPDCELVPISRALPLLLELKIFIEFFGGGPTPKSTAEDAVQVVEVLTQLRALAGFKD